MSVRLVCTDRGVGLLDSDHVALVRCEHPDLGVALADGLALEAIAQAPVVGEVGLDEIALRAPVPFPRQLWAVGLNYRAHVAEIKGADLREPFIFPKAPTAVIGPGDPIVLPPVASDQVDYEGEMALVIGRRAESVPAAQASAVVAGITICNDVSARAVQKGEPGARANISLAKSFRTFAPLGPAVAVFDSVSAPEDLRLQTTVSGELRQSSSTAQMIFGIDELIAYLSARVTLLPGDIIATGTPEGVGDVDGRYLVDGDEVSIELEGVGALRNPVRAA